MAKKSSNTHGNPYHDESDGKFTSSNDGSLRTQIKNIKLKSGADLSGFAQSIKNLEEKKQPTFSSGQIDTNISLTFPNSIEDAEMQGNRILGSKDTVGYANDTSLEAAHSFNQALLAVCTDFPELFNKEKLFLYGTENKKLDVRNYKTIVNSILSEPIYKNKINELGLDEWFVSMVMIGALQNTEKNFDMRMNSSTGGFTTSSQLRGIDLVLNCAIKFNPMHSKNLQNWDNSCKESFAIGHFLPYGDKNVAYMSAAHELGHHIFFQLDSLMDSSEKDQLYQLLTGLNILQSNKQISLYAMSNRDEHIAEAFSNVYCVGDQATKHNKEVVNLLKSVYDRIYGR